MKKTGSKKAVVWRSPFQLWAECDRLLYTSSPERFMKFYPHRSSIDDTYGGIELTACPASYYPPTLKLGSSWSTKLLKPDYRYVDGIKPYEVGFKHPGDVRYMYIEESKNRS